MLPFDHDHVPISVMTTQVTAIPISVMTTQFTAIPIPVSIAHLDSSPADTDFDVWSLSLNDNAQQPGGIIKPTFSPRDEVIIDVCGGGQR